MIKTSFGVGYAKGREDFRRDVVDALEKRVEALTAAGSPQVIANAISGLIGVVKALTTKRKRRSHLRLLAGKKYIVIPGRVRSGTDGDTHFITSVRLMELYKVEPAECYVVKEGDVDALKRLPRLPTLRPRYDGDYRICSCESDSCEIHGTRP